jgi:hypothetical protein
MIALNASPAKSIIHHLDAREKSKLVMHITADEIQKSLNPKISNNCYAANNTHGFSSGRL